MDLRYIARLSFRFLLLLLLVAVLGNICYQVIADGIKQVETTENINGSVDRTVEAFATIVRKEQVVESSEHGVYLYAVSNGQRVQNNKKIVDIYADTEENRSLIEKINKLDREISVLENARNLESAFTASSVEKRLDELSVEFSVSSQNGDKSECDRILGDIRLLLNVKELKSGHTDYKTQLNELEKSRNEAKAELDNQVSSVRSDEPGYFYYDCDGYEDVLGNTDLLNMNLEELEAISTLNETFNENSVGKIVTDHIWYLLVPLSSEDSMKFSENMEYDVTFGDGQKTLSMKLEKLVRKTGRDNAFLVMSYNTVPEDFSFSRNSRVVISYEKYEGFKVPISAVRYLDGYTGVYVLHGSVVEFRRIDIVTLEDAYVICNPDFVTDEGKYKSLKFYDKIIVKGEKLYVGKIIN